MSFETALIEELGTGILAEKVFGVNAEEGTPPPYLVFLSSEGIPDITLQGFLDSKEVFGELNILHDTYSEMKTLAASVLEKLRSFQGRSIGASGPVIQEVTYEQPVEIFEPEIRQYRCHIAFKVNF